MIQVTAIQQGKKNDWRSYMAVETTLSGKGTSSSGKVESHATHQQDLL